MKFNPKEHTVFVCGCARNVAANLPGVLANFKRIGEMFASARFAVVENDSSDNTKELIAGWAAEDSSRRTHIDLTGMCSTIKSRTDRLPICRNELLDEMWKNPADFMVMLDMDGICEEPIPEKSLAACFEEQDDRWGAMTANVACDYYDIWALRSDWCPYDCWKMVYGRPKGMSEDEATQKYVLDHKKPIDPSRPPIEVISAFGGLGVYRTKYLKNCRYSSVSSYGGADVEHCALNEGIRANGGKVFILPSLLIR